MKEVLLVFGLGGIVALLTLRARQKMGTPAAGTAAGDGTHRWYREISSAQWLTALLWGIGAGLAFLVAHKFWGEETEAAWGRLSSKENLWITILSLALLVGLVAKSILTRKEQASSASAHSTYSGGRSRFSLGAVVGILVGLAFLALTVLIVVKILQEIDYGLSNAPERMALRGYVPAERVAAALAAAQPALPEVHNLIAPALGADGTTNWSVGVNRESAMHHLYFNIPDDAESLVRKLANGVVTNFCAETRAKKIEFCSLAATNITIKWWQSKRKLTPQEIAALEQK